MAYDTDSMKKHRWWMLQFKYFCYLSPSRPFKLKTPLAVFPPQVSMVVSATTWWVFPCLWSLATHGRQQCVCMGLPLRREGFLKTTALHALSIFISCINPKHHMLVYWSKSHLKIHREILYWWYMARGNTSGRKWQLVAVWNSDKMWLSVVKICY